ncbi:PREDICTED: uncharacterized protein LOC106749250 [Dinoponera quadriceps]|uniref:Uncharacterized protein LOC106749250 n=1 Tax=Dinoponera quadriceps TaxID=609295 RepID=A0A6P3Y1C8_DINQU|nr:PREDICTED: uncharacterized protein LOC106749250 [Dinoponera quadriceps]
MSSSTFVGNPDVMVAGPPPPPPPPPPMSGQVPAMRINTAENAATKRPQMGSNDAYEPPAAIQNAMLTKDKKPFTYTPGMGGKLDLSQIRSPRMARRVAKNANDEGIEGPPKSALESKPATTSPNPFVQPQVAIPVFPTNVPPVNRVPQPATVNRTPSNVAEKPAEAPKNVVKIDTKAIAPVTPSSPESPNTPTQVTLAKAPTPWLQNKNKPQEELPEWAKRASVSKAGPSECPATSPVYVQVQPRQNKEHESSQQQAQTTWQPTRQNTDAPQRNNPQTQHERVVPIRIEDRPSVFDAKRESGHHQFKQPPTLHHQQRWGQMQQPQSPENRPQDQEQTHVVVLSRPEQTVGTYIIPIVVEGNDKKTSQANVGGSNATGKGPKVVQQRASAPVQQQETGPVQSRSFRVLQKITDTDAPNDVGADQIRRMELSEDERVLMNKFKEQVDHETYLHQEEDPRYRGAAIPSRAFRFLQNMTDSTDASVTCAAPRNAQNVANKRQNRNSKSFEETQANLPPSEQQVQEPKKYMGSAIPSRSFRILQAMTAPESIATQENRQADYTRRTENNLPGNQQGVFLPPPPVPFWHPEGWWGYYPAVRFGEPNKHSFPPYPDGNVYEAPYPLYDPNHLARVKVTGRESPELSAVDARDGLLCENGPHDAADSSFAQEHLPTDAVLPEEINHLDAQSSGAHHRGGDVDGTGDVDRNGIVTAMNIIGEERGDLNEPTLEKTFGLHINVPNYTYVDTSDSSDDDDDEQPPGRKGASDDTTSSNNSSSDSDSYVAYSTGLNPREKPEKERPEFPTDDPGNETRFRKDRPRYSDDAFQRDTTSTAGEDERGRSGDSIDSSTGNTSPDEPIDNDDDAERQDSEGPAFEATDDSEATMVSVSLPLRFKFFVSENNEDVTTVTVGDSKIRAERAKCGRSAGDGGVNDDDVSVDFHVGNDTSVDFTIRRHASSADEASIPQVNFTLRKDPSRSREETAGSTPARDLDSSTQVRLVDGDGITRDQTTSEAKQLSSVQEDTDEEDEDSGVTSDLSRMISEVDTDSECASSKNSKKYQRTQTHSRLFRLLNDDSARESPDRGPPSSRKEYLSLPLNTVFNYDDSYCSNYSSGLTSPEYSPVHEQSWRRFHDASLSSKSEQSAEQATGGDPYFRTWKRPAGLHDVVPSLAHKILDSRLPSWAYKVNVLCPRIKSTKSVPRALTPGKINDPPPTVPPPIPPPTSCANANANYC